MAKTLTDIVKNVKNGVGGMGNYLGKGLGKYLSVGAVAASSYFAGNKAYADKFVNNSMDYTTINTTIASAVSGEDVHFAAGVYEFPLEPVGANILVTSGAHLVPDGTVILRRAAPTAGVVVRLNSVNSSISGFVIENAAKGISVNADFDTNKPIYITNNTIQNVEIGMSWTNKSVSGSNMLPSVIVDGNYIRAVSRGNIFDGASGGPTTSLTAWLKATNNTFEDINTIISEPVFYISGGENGVASGTLVTLGVNDMDGNIIINSDGVTMPPEAYTAIGGPLTSATTAGTTDIPNANGEFDIANCRDDNNCTYPFVNYLSIAFGGDNIASENSADAKISWSRRLLLGSPHWADGKCKNPNGTERHYCGAFAPMGDWNADGKLNDYDQSILDSKKTGENVCSTDDAALSVFDFDNDCDIDNTDHIAFLANGFQGIPTIPTLSTWGLVNLGLATLIAGTIVIDRRKKLSNQNYNTAITSN